VIVQQPASTADAPGGVRALMAATDQAAQEISVWLETLTPVK
jgi:cholesterol transport system auxiliary component